MSDQRVTADANFWGDADDAAALRGFRALAEATDDGIYQLDTDGHFAAVNDAFADLTGYAREELLEEHISMLLEEESGALEHSLTDPTESDLLEFTVRTAEGTRVCCEVRVSPIETAAVRGAVGIVRDSTERERVRKRLAEERDMFAQGPAVVFRWANEDGWPVEYVSANVEDVFGYAPAELESGSLSYAELLLEDERDRIAREVAANSDGTTQRFTHDPYRVRTSDGDVRWVKDTTKIVRDESGTITHYLGYLVDITERKEHERSLEETERRYRALTESFPNGIVTLFDHDLEYTLAAGQGFDRIPLEPADLEGDSVADIWGDTAGTIDPAFEAVLEGDEQSIEVEYAGRDWILYIVPITDERGDVFTGMAMAQDVTERTERERELAKYETIVETIDDGIYVKDEAGRFTMVNEAYAELTGYDREELLGEHASLVVDEETIQQSRTIRSTDSDESSLAMEAAIRTADGDRVPSEGTFATLRTDDGQEKRVGVVRDITERKEYRQKLEESNERLEQFAYAASHDLQEPLRMVSSYLRLIEQRYADELDDDGREFIEFAVDGADRMREMIEGLLEYSRIEAGGDPFEPVDLETVLGDVLEDLRLQVEESDAEIRIESLPTVEGDASQLRQVFQNLLDNAIEYSGEQPPRIRVEADRRDAEWVVSVRDDGIGIDSDDADRVFQVFQRLHTHEDHAGTGIGLALCRRIVERHSVRPNSVRPGSTDERRESVGGEIWVESEPGDGTTISFTLPASTAPES
ncbi:PAS domain S-box protein [Natrinema zhouii]|uniref:histidine kinase n=1 Tax=Natrinema zhouii TaxID=1710539 RepID=A0A7D6CPV9_9EURY|nr:PAS domain S-box protein [Natrinema zhouii]QLK25749.1 PAS domain S-box protein [Natrinema zhouii]